VGVGERFMNCFGSPNTIGQDKVCYGPNVIAESITYGWGPTMYSWPVAGTTGCDVLWGFRPSASMPLIWGAMTAARKSGTKLVVVDPKRTHEAALADLHLRTGRGATQRWPSRS
jgi:anaerobic selenocysteine-containing dehydrogenase